MNTTNRATAPYARQNTCLFRQAICLLLLALSACGRIAAVAAESHATVLPDELKNGLALHFNFDNEPATGTIPDASGSGNNGAATGIKWIAGGRNGGGCAEFSLT